MNVYPNLINLVEELTESQVRGLRNARPDRRLTIDGAWAPATPVLNCSGNVTRDLVAKKLAMPGGMIGPANATVLTVLGERARAAILGRH